MYREQAVSSRVCNEKWQDRSYRIHRQKLQRVKPSIDNKAPAMYPHLYQKLKKAQMEEERCSEIERDNRTLVRRMTEIMQRSAIDTQNPVEYRSLNKEARRRELIRVTQENQGLLKRIQRRQPTYNHLVWEQDRERNEALCERICRYPYRPTGEGEDQMYPYYDEEGNEVAEPPPFAMESEKSPSASAAGEMSLLSARSAESDRGQAADQSLAMSKAESAVSQSETARSANSNQTGNSQNERSVAATEEDGPSASGRSEGYDDEEED